jgi:hypothetical protein
MTVIDNDAANILCVAGQVLEECTSWRDNLVTKVLNVEALSFRFGREILSNVFLSLIFR